MFVSHNNFFKHLIVYKKPDYNYNITEKVTVQLKNFPKDYIIKKAFKIEADSTIILSNYIYFKISIKLFFQTDVIIIYTDPGTGRTFIVHDIFKLFDHVFKKR